MSFENRRLRAASGLSELESAGFLRRVWQGGPASWYRIAGFEIDFDAGDDIRGWRCRFTPPEGDRLASYYIEKDGEPRRSLGGPASRSSPRFGGP